jgi:superoxide reductase
MPVKKINEIYKCEVCGNIVEMVFAGRGELVCCRKPMILQEEKTKDIGNEKHVPVIEKIKTGLKVKVGEIEHPMEENHYIQWIEVLDGEKSYKKFLKPGKKPEAKFCIKLTENIIVREYCNVHGLWKKEE